MPRNLFEKSEPIWGPHEKKTNVLIVHLTIFQNNCAAFTHSTIVCSRGALIVM